MIFRGKQRKGRSMVKCSITAALLTLLLCSCNLFFPTQVSFLNSTASPPFAGYTIIEIKIGSIDNSTTLLPGQGLPYTQIDPGSYTLSVQLSDATWHQWPRKIDNGYSYNLIFITRNGILDCTAYIAMVP
jgi:hypothetical protein